MELVGKGDVTSVFQVMSNELNTPRILVCPADTKRTSATNFGADLNNAKTSYFVGINATDFNSRNVSRPATAISRMAYPIRHGILELTTNQVIGWTTEIHTRPAKTIFGMNFGKIGVGNIGLADGSVEQDDGPRLNQALQNSGAATNRLAIP